MNIALAQPRVSDTIPVRGHPNYSVVYCAIVPRGEQSASIVMTGLVPVIHAVPQAKRYLNEY